MNSRFLWWLFRLFRSNETKVHELNYLFWECTTRCNLRCRHCGSDCGIADRDKDMPLEDFLKAIDTIPKKEIPKNFTVVLTGGEPLLRPDICDVGRALRRRGLRWSIVTNGWFYDSAMHSRLMASGLGALTISLDGLQSEHDWMRGRPGSFQRTLDAIRLASDEKRLNFDVVTCVNKRNLPQLDQLYDLLQVLGVPQWRLFTIIPIGRAASDPDMLLSDSEFKTLMEFIKAKRLAGAVESSAKMTVTFSCEGYLGDYEMQVRRTPFFCHAGINIASVLIDGRISACPNIDRDLFSQGNIYSDNFFAVWQHRFQPFRNRRWARTGQCSTCPVFSRCLGNGMHNWHSPSPSLSSPTSHTSLASSSLSSHTSLSPLTCHYHQTL